MNVEGNANARAAAKYRQRREAAGESQVTVWLDLGLQSKLDALVSTGRFKNRSELIARAIEGFELSEGN
ncbi:hypothetical protein HJA82_29210 [Rhizobium bangladeshense]|uniref:ribbon-helix-helix domain-containing protein n=1 Tax=Rhizobium TaxID=379 RepID=UPI001C8384D1|nr:MULTISPECIES: ribbon-helix-helix domain-containing protein [Rhizobium]MBX4911394.1 hypothetical protein [Rhizobium bangladeshense]MBX5130688.1 hypothetical protein [Rhizobium lentis]